MASTDVGMAALEIMRHYSLYGHATQCNTIQLKRTTNKQFNTKQYNYGYPKKQQTNLDNMQLEEHKVKGQTCMYSQIVWEYNTCTNSVYQAIFPPQKKDLGV